MTVPESGQSRIGSLNKKVKQYLKRDLEDKVKVFFMTDGGNRKIKSKRDEKSQFRSFCMRKYLEAELLTIKI